MNKRWLTLSLVFLLLLGLVSLPIFGSSALIGTGSYQDVLSGSFYEDAAYWAKTNSVTNDIISGNSFSPDQSCTRKEVMTFLWRAFGSKESTVSVPFTDVKTTDYYYKAVRWAVENGIAKGITATTFCPDQGCTRGHVITFLYRAKVPNSRHIIYSAETMRAVKNFVDVDANSFCAKAVRWALENGVTNGMDSSHFGPDLPCTRAHIVTFLYRALSSPLPTDSGGDELPIIPIG